MDLKDRVFRARKAKGLSQEDLAEVVGVSRQAVSKWETGEAMPDMEKLIALCRALELDIEYLALGKEPVPPAPETKRPRKWIAVLLAAVCFVLGILIGHYWPSEDVAEPNLPSEDVAEPSRLESIVISDVTVTPLKVSVPAIRDFEIEIRPSEMPEGLAVAVMWGPLGREPSTTLCIREDDCYRVTLRGYYEFQHRITALLTLDGEEKQIRILDVYGDDTEFEYDYIS